MLPVWTPMNPVKMLRSVVTRLGEAREGLGEVKAESSGEYLGKLEAKWKASSEVKDGLGGLKEGYVEELQYLRKLKAVYGGERVKELEELEELLAVVLKEVHAPPTLMDLSVGKVVEEGLEGQVPPGLRVRVKHWSSERVDKAKEMLVEVSSEAREEVEQWHLEAPERPIEEQLGEIAKSLIPFKSIEILTSGPQLL